MIDDDGTLTDTGPLFALADPQRQPAKDARCGALLLTLPVPLMTTWPYLGEVMYLCGREGGWFMQRYIVRLLREGTLRIHTSAEAELNRSLDTAAST